MAKDEQAEKGNKASELVRSADFGTSVQVLQEFYAVATRKGRKPLTSREALAWISFLAKLPCVTIDARFVMNAIAISEHYRIGYWDAAIVAAAESLGAAILYTEDLNHEQLYGSVRAVNPFR